MVVSPRKSYLQSHLHGENELSLDDSAFNGSTPLQYNVILGCPRSGTTFLLDALSALPNSECVSGHLFPLAIPHILNHAIPPEVYQCLSHSFEFSIQDFLEATSHSRVRIIHKWMMQAMTTFELLQALQGKRKVERFIYKEPFLSFCPEFVYESLPNCRIIHIYRDGRDCADSLVRKYNVLTDEKLATLKTAEMPLGRKYDHRYVPWWVEAGRDAEFMACPPFVRAIWMWKAMARRCHEYFSRPGVMASGRVLQLKYEDLVRDPLRYGELAANHFGCNMNPLLQKKFKAARQNSVGIHKHRETEDLKAAEEVAYKELELYGYLKAVSASFSHSKVDTVV